MPPCGLCWATVLLGMCMAAQELNNVPNHGDDVNPSKKGKTNELLTEGPRTHESLGDLGKSIKSLIQEQKRFGMILGRGMSFGKRTQDKLFKENADMTYVEPSRVDAKRGGYEIDSDINTVDLDGPTDDKRWAMQRIYGIKYPVTKRSKRSAFPIGSRNRRWYFGSVLGRGFAMGKRNSNTEPTETMFEQFEPYYLKNDNPDDREPPSYDGDIKNEFFYVGIPGISMLGKNFLHGYGKNIPPWSSVRRDGYENDETSSNLSSDDLDADPSDISTLEKEIPSTHREEEGLNSKRYFHSSPGHRFLFGNRDKRYGFLLGRGLFSSGIKRFHGDSPNGHRYGHMLGSGYSFGKRSFGGYNEIDENMSNSKEVDKRGSPMVLGRGFLMGKRGIKRFGWVLGNGLKFGKRSEEELNNPEYDSDVYFFIDDDGNTYKFNDDMAYMNRNESNDIQVDDDDQEAETFPSDELENRPEKRFGLILGRGMGFGKRESWRGFGHIIGNGFSFGK